MAMTSFKWREAMKHDKSNEQVIELGSVSLDTKGGPMGSEDAERTYWLHGLGLTRD